MMTNWILLMVGTLIAIEFLIGFFYCVGKNTSYLLAFLSRPFGIPMPSVSLGIVVRALLIVVGIVGSLNVLL